MQKWFQKELKERGFSRYKSRKAYGCRYVNGIEFYVRLINDKHDKEQWYPDFGINIPYRFGISGESIIGICFYHVYMGEIIENDSSADVFYDDTRDELLNTLDTIIIPWIEKYSNIEVLIDHYLERIKKGVPILPHKRYQRDAIRADKNGASDPAAQLLGMLVSSGPPPGTARKFWEYVAIFYNLIGEPAKAMIAIEEFLAFKKLRSPKKGTFDAKRIDRIEAVISEGSWPDNLG